MSEQAKTQGSEIVDIQVPNGVKYTLGKARLKMYNEHFSFLKSCLMA